MSDFRDLLVYKKAFQNAMQVFEMSKKFPPEEKYSLSTQIRNSSRSVCSCIGEGYRKRRYKKHFVSKVSDSDMENSESIVWLDLLWPVSTLKKPSILIWLADLKKLASCLIILSNTLKNISNAFDWQLAN